MKKCAVIIGINKAGNLPILNAAVSGAIDFSKWAISQGFEVTLLTDDASQVTTSEIKKVIKKYVSEKTFSQLIIFFAGHGILKGANDEYWLLSDAHNDPDEAVNVSASRYFAFNAGIPHVTFISDACRSATNNVRMSQITGSVIFPNGVPAQQNPDIDMFFATKPGDQAWEIKDEQDALSNYKGIFTSCIVDGLVGNVDDIISQLNINGENLAVVLPYDLKKHLEKKVPAVAEEIKITLRQYPMIEVTSHSPTHLSVIGDWNKIGPTLVKKAGGPKPLGDETYKSFNYFDDTDFDIKKVLNSKGDKEIEEDISLEIEKLVSAKGRESFETQTGFSIIGTHDFEIILDRGRCEMLSEDGYKHMRLFPNQETKTLLFITKDGMGTPIAVLPGFIGNVLVDNDRVVNVNYIPSRNNNRYNDYIIRSSEISLRRAASALAARHGSFRISGNKYSIMGVASYLRNDKALDPTLGLYAAYAYAQAGKDRDIKSVFEYMKDEPEPVLYDVKVLATINKPSAADLDTRHAPFCPMLTQGWSYMAINKSLFTPELKNLNSHLIPGLWTTFSQEGVGIVKKLFKKNQ